MQIPQALVERYQRLFRFYDRDRDGSHSLEGDFQPVAQAINARWGERPTPFPDLLGLLLSTYSHEVERRDLDGNGAVNEEEFVTSHASVIEAFGRLPQQARSFIAKSAGGFFDCLDLDGDGCLELADLEAYASAFGKPTAGIQANLARMLAAFDLPPDRLPKAVFLELVVQYWFDPSGEAPGRWLFDIGADLSP
ncbi:MULTISPECIES: EF-hand domain-containing protein [unclassified Cyanobium]|uniref:EF-hand domain-containing protein n=1 Tax=unclassified Cyanobium TaxID=2627006 RepID=UPI0020CBEE17|nr:MULTISPECIES: EF-hand domain-containing protein [unclassified Cyanobium]MCP9777922.1 EF-hand domain-containing protein [Cyanobium sp. Tous-M-B4]MCP9875579.1 EF-hand domain-containing protein [Cyanobium sp. A2C-AMD]